MSPDWLDQVAIDHLVVNAAAGSRGTLRLTCRCSYECRPGDYSSHVAAIIRARAAEMVDPWITDPEQRRSGALRDRVHTG